MNLVLSYVSLVVLKAMAEKSPNLPALISSYLQSEGW